MATTTYEPIATQTVTGSSTATITFSSIPQTYTDLVLVSNGGLANNGGYGLRYNNDTSSVYSRTFLKGDGSSVTSARASNEDYVPSTAGGANQTNIWQLQNYSNTTTFKTALSRGSGAGSDAIAFALLWRSTAAINRIDATSNSTFTAGTTFTLYGIANIGVNAKATGGIITSDDTYFYHTFRSSDTFTPQQLLTADYLVVAGGGGGGYGTGNGGSGGGGAGGVRYLSGTSFASATAYTVTVGAGGGANTNGVNSSIIGGAISVSATGGGKGGIAGQNSTAGNGGSGGGSGENTSTNGTGNTGGYSPVEGFAGGNASLNYPGNGGGGAGAVGGNATIGGPSSIAGTGGIGATSATLNVPYATTSKTSSKPPGRSEISIILR
jgi:hypothetical protein